MKKKIYQIEKYEVERIFHTEKYEELIWQPQVNLVELLLESGYFVHIDGYFVPNFPKFVDIRGDGSCELTLYAFCTIKECALLFLDRVVYIYPGLHIRGEYTSFDIFGLKKRQFKEYNSIMQTDELQKIIQEAKEAIKIARSLPRNFAPALVTLMKWRGMTNDMLAERTYMSYRTIQRMRTDETANHEPRKVIAVCVGLRLPPYISREMLALAGITFKNTELDYLYSRIIEQFFNRDIRECNHLLIAANFPPLTEND